MWPLRGESLDHRVLNFSLTLWALATHRGLFIKAQVRLVRVGSSRASLW